MCIKFIIDKKVKPKQSHSLEVCFILINRRLLQKRSTKLKKLISFFLIPSFFSFFSYFTHLYYYHFKFYFLEKKNMYIYFFRI